MQPSAATKSCVEGTYSCLGQCFSNGNQISHVNETNNTLTAYGTATPFFCNIVDGGFEEECGVAVPGTGEGTGRPLQLSVSTAFSSS